jgi:predicted RNA-binding protein Jag
MNEEQIALYMKNLSLTREEAIQLIKDEEEDNLPELTEEQKQVEKEMRQADRKKETAPRKRERKANDAKLHLIASLVAHLDEFTENVTVTNPEREFEFDFQGEHYRLTLAKPRKEKK